MDRHHVGVSELREGLALLEQGVASLRPVVAPSRTPVNELDGHPTVQLGIEGRKDGPKAPLPMRWSSR